MTDAELQGFAAQGFNMARTALEQDRFNFVLAVYNEHEGTHRMTKIEALIIQYLGEDWLNSGRAKDVAFKIIRTAVELMPPDAVIFVTGGNRFLPTEQLLALPWEEQKKYFDLPSHDDHHEAAKQGYFLVRDALMCCAQTPHRVCMYVQMMDERHQPLDPPQTDFWDQRDFGGRMKMFGKEANGDEDGR